MINHLQKILEQLRMVKVQVHSFSVKRQVNLFDAEIGPDISFNECRTPLDYQNQLDHLYHSCKVLLQESLNKTPQDVDVLKKMLDYHRFEVREFKNRYFSKDNESVILNRVVLVKSPKHDLIENQSLKKKSYNFFTTSIKWSKCLTNSTFIGSNTSTNTLIQK